MPRMTAVLSLAAALVLTGCTAINRSSDAIPVAGSIGHDLQATIDVGERISGDTQLASFLFIPVGEWPTQFADGVTYGGARQSRLFPVDEDVAEAMAAAAHEAVKNAGADLIVAPQYTIERSNYLIYKELNVTVEGYKGTIQSID